MPRVEVALVGRNDALRLGPLDHVTTAWWDTFLEGENDRAWDDRHRTTLSVDQDETLAEIFDRAISALEAYEADWSEWDRLNEPGPRTARLMALRADDSPLPLLERMAGEITVVDDAGLGVWGVPLGEVTFGQLERASAAGALYGNPAQIYLFIRWEPAGGGVAHAWEFLVDAWNVADDVLAAIAAGKAAVDLAGAIRRRLAGREVVERRARGWVERNGGVDIVARTLRGDPWRARDLAAILGTTTTDAEGVLALFGYSSRASDDVWDFTAGDPSVGLAPSDTSAEVVVRYTREVLWREGGQDVVPSTELEALMRVMLERAASDRDLSEFGYRGDWRLWPGVWGENRNVFS